MTVDQLREVLATMPGHLPVMVGMPADASGGAADTDYLFSLECTLEAFPSQGRMAVIHINDRPT